MEKTYKLITIFLVIALIFSSFAVVVKNYFPEFRYGAKNAFASGNAGQGGNLRVFINNTLDVPTPAPRAP